jgi:hypothetical protein
MISDEDGYKCMKAIKVGKDMVTAFLQGVEWYQPIFEKVALPTEGGDTLVSYNNLCFLISKFGKSEKVERHKNGNVLVYFTGDERYYLATGFDVGYFGTAPYYFAKFGEEAGFGNFDDLYSQLTEMPRDFAGVVWQKSS